MALAVLYDVLKENMSALTKLKLVEEFDKVLGLDLLKKEEVEISQEIKDLAEERWIAKQNKDWGTADKLRQILLEKGFVVKDSKEGYTLEKK